MTNADGESPGELGGLSRNCSSRKPSQPCLSTGSRWGTSGCFLRCSVGIFFAYAGQPSGYFPDGCAMLDLRGSSQTKYRFRF